MSELQDTKKLAKKPALGRGLGSLLGERPSTPPPPPAAAPATFPSQKEKAIQEGFVEKPLTNSALAKPVAPTTQVPTQQVPEQNRIWNIDIAKLKANKRQPRQIFQPEALKELTASIKEKGILQPIVARPIADGTFEIIAGERRWRAAQAAGLHSVPVIVKATEDQEALELALIENIQRENLNPIEEAEAYNHLIHAYNLTQMQLADKLGKDRATVANILRLLGLSKTTRQMLVDGRISMGHAKVLLSVPDSEKQKELAEKVANKKMSVRELEREVAAHFKKAIDESKPGEIDLDVSAKFMSGLAEELQKIVGSKLTIDYDKGKGKISIHFYSDEQLNGMVEKIREKWRK